MISHRRRLPNPLSLLLLLWAWCIVFCCVQLVSSSILLADEGAKEDNNRAAAAESSVLGDNDDDDDDDETHRQRDHRRPMHHDLQSHKHRRFKEIMQKEYKNKSLGERELRLSIFVDRMLESDPRRDPMALIVLEVKRLVEVGPVDEAPLLMKLLQERQPWSEEEEKKDDGDPRRALLEDDFENGLRRRFIEAGWDDDDDIDRHIEMEKETRKEKISLWVKYWKDASRAINMLEEWTLNAADKRADTGAGGVAEEEENEELKKNHGEEADFMMRNVARNNASDKFQRTVRKEGIEWTMEVVEQRDAAAAAAADSAANEDEESRKKDGEETDITVGKVAAVVNMREKIERRAKKEAGDRDASYQLQQQEQQALPQSQQHPSSSTKPTSQPTNADTNNSYEYQYQQTYDSLFQPRTEQYDLLNFDPYSLSGAPLGGWGRATRSRLASLPIRLVSDYEAGIGVDLWYGNANDDGVEEQNEGAGESSESTKESITSTIMSQEKEDESTAKESTAKKSTSSSSSSIPADLKRSTGPHFSVWDATGQRYICRIYAEDELIVLSRLDSVFHPAVTVWDDVEQRHVQPGSVAQADLPNERGDERDGSSKHADMKYQFRFNDKGGNDDDVDDVPDGLRPSVAKMLRRMGMNGAADALSKQLPQRPPNQRDISDEDNREAFSNGAVDEGRASGREEVSEANRAASAGKTNANNENDGSISPPPQAAAVTAGVMPAQLNNFQIHTLLSKLKGHCSQLHTRGWWSYEWCHEKNVRQYHVEVSRDPIRTATAMNSAGRGGDLNYDIQDMTLMGEWGRTIQIIYPAGVYDGKLKKGSTAFVTYDPLGEIINIRITFHSAEDDEKYARLTSPWHDGTLGGNPRKSELPPRAFIDPRRKTGYDRGPIIRQVFENGDFCKEANIRRSVAVEFRCCTEREIESWMPLNKDSPLPEVYGNGEESVPLGVLVELHEDETCRYRSRICTPLLCPTHAVDTPVTDASSSNNDGARSSTKTTSKMTEEQKARAEKDPFGVLLDAIFGGNMVVDIGQAQVLIPDPVTGQEFEELIRIAENGGDFLKHPSFGRVKRAMRKSRGNKMDLKDLIGDDEDNRIRSSLVTSMEDKMNPSGALLDALFGGEMDVDNFGQVKVHIPDPAIGQEFDELIRMAENGGDFLNHPSFRRVKRALQKTRGNKMGVVDLIGEDEDNSIRSPLFIKVKDGMSIRDTLDQAFRKEPCLKKNLGWWTYKFCHSRFVRQIHTRSVVDSSTGFAKQIPEVDHSLGAYLNSGNSITDYPNEEEHLHVLNASGTGHADWEIGHRKGPITQNGGLTKNEKQPGRNNGAMFVQEYAHGEDCDHEDVADSVVKGGNVVERSTTVRFSCGKRLELIDIKEDSTCHYIFDVTVPELCHHELFRAVATKTQVVKCLPV